MQSLNFSLPIGQGEIDFEYIFSKILKNYEGKLILEVVNIDLDIINSKKVMDKPLKDKTQIING